MTDILSALAEIKEYSLLAAKNVLTIDDVALLTGMSKSHIYKLTCNREIPHYKPNGKTLFFDRSEIEDWQRQDRVETNLEAQQRALSHTLRRGGAR